MQVTVSGTRLWFDVDGPVLVADGPRMRERPTVVLLHGGPGSFDHSYLKPDFARLAEVAQVVYLDVPDHGRSSRGDPADWTFEEAADRVHRFCEAVGIERPVLYGHSFGGVVAMLCAARHSDGVAALVLQSTMARFDLARTVEAFRRVGGDAIADVAAREYGGGAVSDQEWAACWRLFGPWVPGPDERARTVVNAALNPPGRALMRELDVRAELAAVRCPVLVCVGDLDPITSVDVHRELVAALPAGLARLEVLPGAGHFPWRDAPGRYWPVLTGFVAEQRLPERGAAR